MSLLCCNFAVDMREMIISQESSERAVLVGLITPQQDETRAREYIDELAFLADTAGAVTVKTFFQRVDYPNPRTFVGKGKLEEIRAFVEDNEIGMVIFDDDLTSKQVSNLEKELKVKILDRTALILDIFARRAQTAHAKTQVELAQYQYLLPRLTRMWTHLERQRGGIGMRGPGETQIETDRRIILDKISRLKEELRSIDRQKSIQRKNRGKLTRVALVGYTNAGKSTLLNCLTNSDIPANDRLFDTLDTTTRKLRIDELTEVLISDTVGFIRKLPHHLIEAFKATLEELAYADVLLHVIDTSNPDWEEQARVVDSLINQLGAEQTPCIRVFNKCDAYMGILPHGENIVCLSAKSGEGVQELVQKLSELLDRGSHHVMLRIPYSDAGIMDLLNREASVKMTEYTDEGIEAEVIVPPEIFGRVKRYIPGYVEPKEDWED